MCLPHLRISSRGQGACVFIPTIMSSESKLVPGTQQMLYKYVLNGGMNG